MTSAHHFSGTEGVIRAQQVTVLSVTAFSEEQPSQKGSKYHTPKGDTKITLIFFTNHKLTG